MDGTYSQVDVKIRTARLILAASAINLFRLVFRTLPTLVACYIVYLSEPLVCIFKGWNPLLCRNRLSLLPCLVENSILLIRFPRVINPSTANAKTQLQRITWQRKGILLMWQVQRMKCHANREISHTEPAWVSLYMCQTDYMARFYSVHYNKYYASHYWSYIYVHYFWTNDRWTAASSVKTTSTLYAPKNRNKLIHVLLLNVQLHRVNH